MKFRDMSENVLDGIPSRTEEEKAKNRDNFSRAVSDMKKRRNLKDAEKIRDQISDISEQIEELKLKKSKLEDRLKQIS